MAQDPKNYRDPKVTTDTQGSRRAGRSSMSWLWIVLGVIVLLLVLAWLFGWMGTNRVATVPVDDPVVVEEGAGAVIEDTEQGLEATGDAVEGAAEETGEALDETGQAIEGAAEEAGDTIDITPEAEAPEVGDEVETQTVPIQPAD